MSPIGSTFAYSPERAWLTSVTHAKDGTTHLSLAYTQDLRGRITQVAANNANESWQYQYDDLDQLTQASNVGDTSKSQSFTYDNVGNMLTQTGVGTYAYPTPGPTAVRPHAATSIAGVALDYDANGNMITGAGHSYEWDGENRPSSITKGTALTTFVYGPDGARLKKLKKWGHFHLSCKHKFGILPFKPQKTGGLAGVPPAEREAGLARGGAANGCALRATRCHFIRAFGGLRFADPPYGRAPHHPFFPLPPMTEKTEAVSSSPRPSARPLS